MHHTIPCGSELARDSGVAVGKDVECEGPIASKGFVVTLELHH